MSLGRISLAMGKAIFDNHLAKALEAIGVLDLQVVSQAGATQIRNLASQSPCSVDRF